MPISKALSDLNIINKFSNQSWYADWYKVQDMEYEEYIKYFNNNLINGREYRFLRIAVDPRPVIELRFQWDYRTMIQTSDSGYKTQFGISSATNLFSDARALMLDQANFERYCLEFGITKKDLDYFFSKEMEMKDSDWEHY